ncbi:unnamed protein product [Rotaria sp. Silwood2]|nr:unnamed protein product [Rotaria sp. Silwood2]CAF4324133.1 unnamed protein product [Rotaria sp. Silwood2]
MALLVDSLCNFQEESAPQSLPETPSTTATLDDVIHQCGRLGRFQWRQYCFLNLIQISAGLASFYYVFGAAEPDHRCRLAPSLWPNDDTYTPINQTHALFLQLYIPTKDGKWDQCHLFDSLNINKSLIECPNGLVFDRSIYGFTFTEAIGLVCRDRPKKSLLATPMQAGGFIVLIAGILADKFGRKRTIIGASILLFSICFITQIIIQWIPMSINMK